jgi:hypothetical protein
MYGTGAQKAKGWGWPGVFDVKTGQDRCLSCAPKSLIMLGRRVWLKSHWRVLITL